MSLVSVLALSLPPLLLLLLSGTPTAALNATHIVIGQSTDLSGPFAEFGLSSQAGLLAAFHEANTAGGVLGRNVTLVTLDDGSNATVAQRNFHLLTGSYNASLLAANYGADTFSALLPLVMQSALPFIGPMDGSPSTRTPFRRQVVNIRTSWIDEIRAHATLLVEKLRVRRVACVHEPGAFDAGLLSLLVEELDGVGMQLGPIATYTGSSTSMATAVENVLSGPRRAHSVVLLAKEAGVISFITKFRQDLRADPNCTFHILSVGASPSFASKLGRQHWHHLHISQTVPAPDSSALITQRFANLSAGYPAPQYPTDSAALEGYVVGRFIVEVLQQMKTNRMESNVFLDQIYSTHLFFLDDLSVGLYMGTNPGCEDVLCRCNAGLRKVFLTTLDPVTGFVTSYADWPVFQYPITSCAASRSIMRPILFGQLIPLDDPVAAAIAHTIAEGILDCFDTDVNPAGGLFGRTFQLISLGYTGEPAAAARAFVDRYPLSALMGSVVADASALTFPILSIGTYDLTPHTSEPAFRNDDLRVQPSTPLELMALVSYATTVSPSSLHFRVRSDFSTEDFMPVLIKTVNTLQRQPTTATTFMSAAQALDGLSKGVVIALGTDADLLQWAELLVQRPALTLLTLSISVHRLVAANRTTTTAEAAFSRIRYASVSRGVQDSWGSAPVPDFWEYGHLLGHLAAYALSLQYLNVPYISPDIMMNDWYAAKLLKQGSVVVGPYNSNNCSSASDTECACNLGARNLAIVSPDNSLPELFTYEANSCRVTYVPLIPPRAEHSTSLVLPVSLGISLGVLALTLLLWRAAWHGKRNNRAAPKDASQPFCILFTDIQSSTSLWATIPEVIAGALDTHHTLMRKLIAKHGCYEVKTIGDSFMCATKCPAEALRFALALQEELAKHDWGTDRMDTAYADMMAGDTRIPGCWNGLRVRVGIHYGCGDIKLDPVSHGYDYYGTVVNTAARIESVCHGGQIGVSEAVFVALGGHFPGAVWADLGLQPLRGLAEPIHLYQVLPEGALSQRRFPALRIERADVMEEVLAAAVGEDHAVLQPCSHSHRNSTSHGSTSEASHDKWIEAHPLVLKGDINAEELRGHYHILQAGLTTLLAPLAKGFRHQVVQELCTRLHVPNHGLDGPQLRSTLHGLIRRLLPATVVLSPGRRYSGNSSGLFSHPSPKELFLSPRILPMTSRSRASKASLSPDPVVVEPVDSCRNV